LDVRGGDLKKRGEAVITVERRQRSYVLERELIIYSLI
jgi:hypothetical protein